MNNIGKRRHNYTLCDTGPIIENNSNSMLIKKFRRTKLFMSILTYVLLLQLQGLISL